MQEQLGIDGGTAALVVLTTVAMYLTLVLCVRLVGQRSLATMSSFDLGCAIALGAVVGRTVLLLDPTLATGVVAIVTLFATQTALARLRQNRWVDRLMNRPPVLLMAGQVAAFSHRELKSIASYLGSLPSELKTVPQSRFR